MKALKDANVKKKIQKNWIIKTCLAAGLKTQNLARSSASATFSILSYSFDDWLITGYTIDHVIDTTCKQEVPYIVFDGYIHVHVHR